MSWIEEALAELRRCTDCGLCLSACPTFPAIRAEGASPRGRVHLISGSLASAPDPAAAQYLAGCLECGACHDPCPTGVRVAVARRAHRGATERLDRAAFDHRIAGLRAEMAADPGAELSVQAASDLLDARPTGPGQRTAATNAVLPLAGPMLHRAAPDLVARAVACLRESGLELVDDPDLSTDLERASGLLHDLGLCADHDDALARVVAAGRTGPPVTIVALDAASLRLRTQPLPAGMRVVPAHDVLVLETNDVPATAVRDSSVAEASTAELGRFEHLPAVHLAAGAPVLLAEPALATVRQVVAAQRSWLAGRRLITADARVLARFPGAIHVTALLGRRLRPGGAL